METVCGYQEDLQAGRAGGLADDFDEPAGGAGAAGCGVGGSSRSAFMSRKLLAECRSFVRRPDGEHGARPGTHDDRVMAMAIGLGARAEMLGKAAR